MQFKGTNKFHTSYIEISKSALKRNLNFINSHVGKGIKKSIVVKGNAYGHGIEEFTNLATELGVKDFSVFNAYEAYRVYKNCGDEISILIMGMIDNYQLEWAIEHNIEFYIFELDRLKAALKAAKKVGKPAHIHIEAETGFHRTGFIEKDFEKAIGIIKNNKKHLKLEGLCTHYAGAESISNYFRIRRQIERYKMFRKILRENKFKAKFYHSASSAATFAYPETIGNMVRLGIIAYGLWPSREIFIHYVTEEHRSSNPIKRIISWKSKVMAIEDIAAGNFIGYGMSYMASNDMKTAVIPIGYAEGFSRSLSNQGQVLIRGRRARVVGRVNMNMIIVDVTDIPGVEKGDEVVIIGKQKNMSLTVASFGEMINLLNYEFLTRLPEDIPRVIVK